MRQRRIAFALSVGLSAAAYYGLYLLAPHIALLSANAKADAAVRAFRVDLRKEIPPRPEKPLRERGMSDAPESLRSLLEQEVEPLPLAERADPVAATPELQARALQEVVPRSHALAPDPSVAEGLDARIVEIARDTARSDISIPRRVVRPSPNRVLEEGVLPSIRTAGGENAGPVAPIAVAPRVFDAPPQVGAPGPGEGAESGGNAEAARPRPEMDVLSPVIAPRPESAPGMTPEVAAFEPVREALREQRDVQALDAFVNLETSTYIDPRTNEGYFRMRIVPKPVADIGLLPKDITFVIDASSSIAQRRLDNTVRGVQTALQSLRPDDRFNVVVFRDQPSFFSERPVPATPESISAASGFIEGLESIGSTNVYSAIRPVVLQPPREGIPSIVMVLSDGRPTSGNMEGRELIQALTQDNVLRNSVYAFGAGRTVNRELMDMIAYRNKGLSNTIDRIDDVDEALPEFVQRFDEAVMAGPTADFSGVRSAEIYPQELPDFYRGRVVTLYGKFDPTVDRGFVLRVKGQALSETKEVVLRADLTGQGTGDASLVREWAFEKSYHLIGEITRVGEQPEIMRELRTLHEEHGIQTPYFPK